MSGNATTWMPLYPGSYFKKTRRLTTEQHGAYFLLILDYWTSGPPPDDDNVLAAITGLSRDAWGMHRACLAQFFQIRGGQWRHARIEEEKAKAVAYAEARTERARVAANARWNAESNAPSMPDALLGECPPPSPSPSPIPSKAHANGVEKSTPSATALWRAAPCGVSEQIWADFKTNRKKKRLSNTPTAYRRLEDDLTRISAETGQPKESLLEYAAAKGWGGIYNPTENGNGRGTEPADGLSPTSRAALRVFGPG